MSKLLLIDGSNLLFQMFYGMPSRINNSEGKPIHGALGFVGALLKIIRMVEPSHVVALFDGECANPRAELVAEYKANRPDYSQVEERDDPFSQLSYIYDALDYLNIKRAETSCCEADDWIAAYALRYGKEMQVVVSSFDSDFFQLISDNVSVLRYRGKSSVICTPNFVRDRFGIEPQQYADFKAMVGDVADNVKGAPKIGVKTAAKLLKQFGSLDNVIACAEQIAKPSIRQSVVDNALRLAVNYQIIKLTDGAALPFNIDELQYALQDGIKTLDVLKQINLI